MSEEDSSPEEVELSSDEDEKEAFDKSKHASLMRSITALDGKVKASSERREAISMSEHHAPAAKGPVKLQQLVGALGNKLGHTELKKQINRVKKRLKVLPVPLSKPEQQRIHRSLAFEGVNKDLSKWDPIVKKHRLAEQLVFPLEQPDIRILSSPDELVKRIQPKTALETEVAALLGEHKPDPEKVLTPAEEKALKAMSIEEACQRRAELQKYRALLSYKESKARRQNKIKSKTYHRILRKEKLKKEKKMLDELEKSDPEGYLKRLNEADANRIQERISLKHRGGSKFAKKQLLYNKYSDQSRDAVQEMLQKSRELSKKVAMETDSSDSEASTDGKAGSRETKVGVLNPWMAAGSKMPKASKLSSYSKPMPVANTVNEMSDSDEGSEGTEVRSKGVMEVNIDSLFDNLEMKNLKTLRQMKNLTAADLAEDEGDSENDDDDNAKSNKPDIDETLSGQNLDQSVIKISMKRKQTLEDFDDLPSEAESEPGVVSYQGKVEHETDKVRQASVSLVQEEEKVKSSDVLSVDPKKFLTIDATTRKMVLAEGDQFDEEQTQGMSIAQAFASDDVIEEFSEEKKTIEERDKPKDFNIVLPGWGEWGGKGFRTSKRTEKAPPAAPRRDRNLDNVIISEVRDRTIAKHQVRDVPFPFRNPEQFENSIRQPIGKTWNPETAYKKLIEPKKVTRIGTVIPPMDKSQVNKNIKEDKLKPRKKRRK
ncbi:hypothetical protein LSH36_157g01027 [Paralvinella palmiformis]|uniref:U3 small nucleolar RNA-associated protein 14 homolog A n=1 Tax=Paralvinella palmiformis TaxID=53620 RepID=A0AAD9JU81_9ANNE|nr:hypothetical protein LSH36_157g01027 [Paralvinella palmiformis]